MDFKVINAKMTALMSTIFQLYITSLYFQPAGRKLKETGKTFQKLGSLRTLKNAISQEPVRI